MRFQVKGSVAIMLGQEGVAVAIMWVRKGWLWP